MIMAELSITLEHDDADWRQALRDAQRIGERYRRD
jgi:hypothetical protein